jgi:hypothetical protein
MSWFLFLVGWLALGVGAVMFFALPLMYQPYAAPVLVIGALWIGFAGVVERLDMIRRTLERR